MGPLHEDLPFAADARADSGHPEGCDWVVTFLPSTSPLRISAGARVASGLRVSPDFAVFHDCRVSALQLAPVASGEAGAAGSGLALLPSGFSGSYVSLAADLPGALVEGSGRDHVIRVACRLTRDTPIVVHCRLNIRIGPDTVQLMSSPERSDRMFIAEFALNGVRFVPGVRCGMWVDFIVEPGGANNRISIGRLSVSRRVRAEF
jgi:hypothetical protein